MRYIDLRRQIERRRVNFLFDHSIMRDLGARLMEDPIFAQRMPAIVRAVGATLRQTGLIRALSYVPARFQTPMEVRIKRS